MKKKIFYLPIFIILIFLDQLSKVLVTDGLKNSNDIILIKNVLSLTYIENRGAAFSILQNQMWLFYLLTLIIIAFVAYVIVKIPFNNYYKPLFYALIFFSSGALGNFIDRISRHYVVDFIYFSIINFPVFNFADIYVTCSIFVIILLIIFKYKDENDFDFLKLK